jgi:murein DD-endopeptidase MepM/ murein hydrolase activator NlpD
MLPVPMRGVMAGITAGLVLIVAAADVRADPPPTTTTDVTTSTQPTTTTTSTTTTAPTTTATVTTAPATTTDTQTAPVTATASSHTFGPRCAVAAVALIRPGEAPLAIGPIASASLERGGLNRLSYPANGSTVTAAAVDVRASGCGRGLVRLESLSLFGKAVSAATVTLRIGTRRSIAIAALRVLGRPTTATAGKRIPLARWGYLVIEPPTSALAVHLLESRSGLQAGTVLLVAVVAGSSNRATAQHRKRKRRATHEPLRVTPPLALRHYTFPVLEPAEYIDTYGAFRSDVPGNWHHGDDIFAPLGTPVVAVATGTINRIGWEHLGGWRLWVRDEAGDEFYYAHLSGYTAGDLHSNKVRAGHVIGFIGNTGDAFTTSPHLHFEIHPRSLLHLGYDGAVDPTTYLDHWTHLRHIRAPAPVHPRLPTDPPLRSEARYVFRELLAARHLTRHAPKPGQRPHIEIPSGANGFPLPLEPAKAESAAPIPTGRNAGGLSPLIFALLVGLGSLVLFVLTTTIAKRRRNEADE